MTTLACPHSITAGTYLLGMLHIKEHNEFRRHSESCVHCLWEIEELRPGAFFLLALKAERRRTRFIRLTRGSRRGRGCCRTRASRR